MKDPIIILTEICRSHSPPAKDVIQNAVALWLTGALRK